MRKVERYKRREEGEDKNDKRTRCSCGVVIRPMGCIYIGICC